MLQHGKRSSGAQGPRQFGASRRFRVCLSLSAANFHNLAARGRLSLASFHGSFIWR